MLEGERSFFMGRNCVMNVYISRWGGEGINWFPGSEEKLAVFAKSEASWEDRGVIQLFV